VNALVPGLDLDSAVACAVADGAAFVSGALEPAFLPALHEGIERGPFESAPQEVGPVRQRTEAYTVDSPFDGAVGALAEALTQRLRSVRVRGLATWRPSQVAVQRYQPGPLGITPHLDGKRFRRLVAVVTTSGSATFAVHAERDGPPIREWTTGPGDLVLLRAPGLAGARDGRPFHSIGPPGTGLRYSVGLRMARAQ